jgi:hypothetical protein
MCSTEPTTEAPFVAAEWSALAFHYLWTPLEMILLLCVLFGLAKICLFV